MTDLRRLAEAAQGPNWANDLDMSYPEDAAYICAASPDAILALLDERDRLRAALEMIRRTREIVEDALHG